MGIGRAGLGRDDDDDGPALDVIGGHGAAR
jgi:hypothetical protein